MSQSLVRITEMPPVLSKNISDYAEFKRQWKVGPLVKLSGDQGSLIPFLGRVISERGMQSILHSNWSPPGHEAWADQLRLLMSEPDYLARRASYVCLMHETLRTSTDEDVLREVPFELRFWERVDRELRWDFVDSYIDQDADASKHMLWSGRISKSGTPTINYHGCRDVPIYRILWPLYKPTTPLPRNRIPKRTPNCPAEFGPTVLCVNPLHYYLPEPLQPAPNLRTKRGMIDHRTPKMSTYGQNASGVWVCDRCSRPLSERAQHRLNVIEGITPASAYDTTQEWYGKPRPDRMHCPTCYRMRMLESGGLGKQQRGPIGYVDQRTPQEIIDTSQLLTDFAWHRMQSEDEEPAD